MATRERSVAAVAAASAGRMLERRTRTRTSPAPDEILVIHLIATPLWGALRVGGRALKRVVRRVRLVARPQLVQVGTELDDFTEEVRVRGTIEPLGALFATAGGSEPAVFARSVYVNKRMFRQPQSYTDETRGVDFVVRLASGEAVGVQARDVRLHDPPRRIWAPNLDELERRGGDLSRSRLLGFPPFVREVALRPGDSVEATGVLVRRVAAHGAAAFGRGTPLMTELAPRPGHDGVWLRRV